ncbi:arsenate reductase (glutaredoxin) [Ferribacterium limneticum]|uniref:arsenate reductase (glutaredoxin) n=1 Tax=Ferribacterium limneticum TaxID=76259 RepID=UPI001CFBD20F|nr:arsenate reductase (glutaredoxin) [Ferribacterium limneticum]UCV17518.1 arsenate reductase (glutaredoxin) [Ferribacterium limneticum]
MTITIYHNNRCGKSRDTLALLKEKGIEPEIVAYLDTPPDAATLRSLLKKLGFADARALMRKGEAEYKELNLADPSLSQDALIDAMVANPKLIERPIVVNGDHAALGRPPENVLAIL